ncbi:MAG: hypothetical protein HYV35_09585 [Lentisphaerae bacterium]|nr:hypothetical protein [Lentisphaerota bacterium]
MNGKKMALIVGLGLYGLTAFGFDYLYDSQGKRYDLANASSRNYGNNTIIYNVKITDEYYTNMSYGTAVIFYNNVYDRIKIFKVHRYGGTNTLITAIEAMPTTDRTFGGTASSGGNNIYPLTLSFYPIGSYSYPYLDYSTLSEQPVLDNGLASGGESAPMPVRTLSADENISASWGEILKFSADLSPYYFIFDVYTVAVLDYFPQAEGHDAKAWGMIVNVSYTTGGETHKYTTAGVFYGFQVGPDQYRLYFTVHPSPTFQVSFTIVANYFTASGENSLKAFTLSHEADTVVRYVAE